MEIENLSPGRIITEQTHFREKLSQNEPNANFRTFAYKMVYVSLKIK